jgi:hypothetical protein
MPHYGTDVRKHCLQFWSCLSCKWATTSDTDDTLMFMWNLRSCDCRSTAWADLRMCSKQFVVFFIHDARSQQVCAALLYFLRPCSNVFIPTIQFQTVWLGNPCMHAVSMQRHHLSDKQDHATSNTTAKTVTNYYGVPTHWLRILWRCLFETVWWVWKQYCMVSKNAKSMGR